MEHKVHSTMPWLLLLLLECCVASIVQSAQEPKHGDFQYNRPADDRGEYIFAYDTGSEDAHSMRMEHRDDLGTVRGRYGYTDPRGKLRMVEYEAGPEGFKARGDVGPDLSPHDEAPISKPQKLSYLQVAGWDPVTNPFHSAESIVGPSADFHAKEFYVPVKENLNRKSSAINSGTLDHKTYQPPIRVSSPAELVLSPPEPISVLEPVTLDHPVKGYQAPAQLAQKTMAVELDHHPVHSPKTSAVLAPATVDHPVKGYNAPVPIVQKSIPVEVEQHVDKLHSPPKTVSVVMAPPTVDHPVKGHQPTLRVVQKSVPVELDHHVDKVYSSPKTIAREVAPATVDHPVKGYQAPVPIVEKSSAVELDHHVEKSYVAPKTVAAVVAPARVDHPVKGHQVAVPLVQKSSAVEIGHHVERVYSPPKSVAAVVAPVTVDHPVKGHQTPVRIVQKSAPVKVGSYTKLHPPPKTVAAVVAPATVDHPVKGYQAPVRIVQKSAPIEVDHHVDKVYSPPKSMAAVVAQPVVDHRIKGYQAPARIVEKSVPGRADHHVHKTYSGPKAVAALVASAPVEHHVKGYRAPAAVVQKISAYEHDHHPEKIHPVKAFPAPKPIIEKSDALSHHKHAAEFVESPKSVSRAAPISVQKDHITQKTVFRAAPVMRTKTDHHHHEPLQVSPKVSRVTAVRTASHDHHHDHKSITPSKVVERISPIREAPVDHHHHGKTVKTAAAKAYHNHGTVHHHVSPMTTGHYTEKVYKPAVVHKGPVFSSVKEGKTMLTAVRQEPLTVRNIDVSPDEIRVAAPAQPHHHHHSTQSTRYYSRPRVVASVPVDSREVLVHDHSSPRRSVNSSGSRSAAYTIGRSSSSTAHVHHDSITPRRVMYRATSRYSPGAFYWE